MNIDYAIRKNEPSSITKTSTPDVVDLYEKWETSNRLSMMFIKTNIFFSIRSSVDQHEKVKDRLKVIDDQFVTSNKSLVNTLIMQFSSLKLHMIRGARDHFMRMRNIVDQLKALEVTMLDSFLINYILCTIPVQYAPIKIFITHIRINGQLMSY